MFFEQLTRLCEAKNTTPTKFVTTVLRLSSSKVTAWKNGSIPKYEILNMIADYFNVSIGELFDGKKGSPIELSEIENKLLSDFRSLSEQGKDYIQQQMFMAKEVYKKQNISTANINTKVG